MTNPKLEIRNGSLLVVLCLLAVGCAPRYKRRPPPVEGLPAPEVKKSLALIFYAGDASGPLEDFLAALSSGTSRVGLILSGHALRQIRSRNDLAEAIKAHVSSGTLELLGTSFHPAPLPLLFDTWVASGPLTLLPRERFLFPADVMEQVSRGRELIEEVLSVAPNGFYPPRGLFSREIVEAISMAGYDWAVIRPFGFGDVHAKHEGESLCAGLSVAGRNKSLNVAPLPYGEDARPLEAALSLGWYSADKLAAFKQGISTGSVAQALRSILERCDGPVFWVVDLGGLWRGRARCGEFLQAVSEFPRLFPSEIFEGKGFVREEDEATSLIPANFNQNYDLWIGDPQRNSLWEELIHARRTLEVYKNSGQANLSRLEAAMTEIFAAESADWFEGVVQPESIRWFRSYLNNVYRLLGQEPPSPGELASGGSSRVKVLEGWRVFVEDSIQDDFGPGHYTYPLNSPLKFGSMDLVGFGIREEPGAKDFLFEVSFLSQVSENETLVDIYVDLNGRVGAGTTALLPGRNGFTAPKDAWEFAITFTPKGATFYRANMEDGRGEKIQDFSLSLSEDKRKISVRLPQELLRGDPARWGYLVGSLGYDAEASTTGFVRPVRFLETDRDFGGGSENGSGINFIDVISGAGQRDALGVDVQGMVQIPFVRAQK